MTVLHIFSVALIQVFDDISQSFANLSNGIMKTPNVMVSHNR